MSAMLERMAEAMWSVKTTDDAAPLADAPQTEPMWRGLPERERDRWRYRARAALLAIREPEQEIVNHGVDAGHGGPGPDDILHLPTAFTAMIDAILNERP